MKAAIKVAIITVVYNAKDTIAACMQSVLEQNYAHIDYIIIDGNSNDGTQAIINDKISQIQYYISAPDNGIYNAMNKGMNAADADYVMFINADDTFLHSNVIGDLIPFLENKKIDALLTGVFIFKKNKPFRIYGTISFRAWMFRFGHQPPHPGFICKLTLMKKIGGFNESFKIAGDFDLMLRLFNLKGFQFSALTYFSVKMLHGGASAFGIKTTRVLNKEILSSLKQNGYFSNSILIYSKYLFKIWQLILPKLGYKIT